MSLNPSLHFPRPLMFWNFLYLRLSLFTSLSFFHLSLSFFISLPLSGCLPSSLSFFTSLSGLQLPCGVRVPTDQQPAVSYQGAWSAGCWVSSTLSGEHQIYRTQQTPPTSSPERHRYCTSSVNCLVLKLLSVFLASCVPLHHRNSGI